MQGCGSQGEYREKSWIDSFLVLAAVLNLLLLTALSSWFGLFLTVLSKRPTSLLTHLWFVTPLFTLLVEGPMKRFNSRTSLTSCNFCRHFLSMHSFCKKYLFIFSFQLPKSIDVSLQALQYTANDYRQTTDKLIFKHVISTLRWIRK